MRRESSSSSSPGGPPMRKWTLSSWRLPKANGMSAQCQARTRRPAWSRRRSGRARKARPPARAWASARRELYSAKRRPEWRDRWTSSTVASGRRSRCPSTSEAGHPGLGGDLGRGAGRLLHRGEGVDGAVQDGAAEQAARPVGDRQAGHGGRARRLPGRGDPAGRAAERGDVVADPFQGGDLVEEAPVAGEGRTATGARHMTEPLEAETAVEGDDDEPFARERGAVEVGLGRGTEDVRAAMDPDQHGQVARAVGGHPEVQREDVLVTG